MPGARIQLASAPIRMLVYVNGLHVPEEEATVSVYDSGFNFADGVFEGIRVYGGRVFRLDEHIDRLYASAAAFEIEIRMSRGELAGEILSWLRANRISEAFHFRPVVTRGRRFPPRLDPRFCSGEANLVFVGGPISPARGEGIRAIVSSLRRPAADVMPPHVKSLNYGTAVLARLESMRRGVDESILLDDRGRLAEASAANVFVVRGATLLTPTTRACLSGITRRVIMDLAAGRGFAVEEGDIEPDALRDCDEIFLTGTGMELVPVIELDGRPVGTGGPGPIATELAQAYRSLVGEDGVCIDPDT